MDILRAETGDIPEIIAVQKLAFYDVALFCGNFRIRPLQTTIGDLQEIFDSWFCLKAVTENRIVGSVRGKNCDGVCKVENLIVHPDYQNRGIGKKLIQRLESEFSDCSSFELFTGKDTPKNVSFYERMGYSVIKERAATDTEPVFVIMKKERV